MSRGATSSRRALVVGMVAVFVGACGQRSAGDTRNDLRPVVLDAPSLASAAVGCWALQWDFEDGSPSVVPDSVSLRGGVIFGTPERVVSPATHPSGRQRRTGVGGADDPWEARYRVNRWWVEGGSVRVRFTDRDEGGWNVRLGPVGDDLMGEAERLGRSARGEPRDANVTATRISCDIR